MRVLTGDTLRITAWCSVASVVLNCSLQINLKNGKTIRGAHALRPTSDRAATVLSIPLQEGIIESVAVFTSTTGILRGDCFVTAQVFQGNVWQSQPHAILISDYVESMRAVTYPLSFIQSPVSGLGRFKTVSISNPAAGANFSAIVPTGALWRVRSISFKLVCDANAANRYSHLNITDGTNILGQSFNTDFITASQTGIYAFRGERMSRLGGYASNATLNPLLDLPAAHTINSAVSSIQVDDQLSDIRVHVEEFIYASS